MKTAIILTVEEAQLVAGILNDHARNRSTHAARTHHVAIRAHCETSAAIARDLEHKIVHRLYGHDERYSVRP